MKTLSFSYGCHFAPVSWFAAAGSIIVSALLLQQCIPWTMPPAALAARIPMPHQRAAMTTTIKTTSTTTKDTNGPPYEMLVNMCQKETKLTKRVEFRHSVILRDSCTINRLWANLLNSIRKEMCDVFKESNNANSTMEHDEIHGNNETELFENMNKKIFNWTVESLKFLILYQTEHAKDVLEKKILKKTKENLEKVERMLRNLKKTIFQRLIQNARCHKFTLPCGILQQLRFQTDNGKANEEISPTRALGKYQNALKEYQTRLMKSIRLMEHFQSKQGMSESSGKFNLSLCP